MEDDSEDKIQDDEDEKYYARVRGPLRALSPFPDARTGLTGIQATLTGCRYRPGEPLTKRFWSHVRNFSLARGLYSTARHCRQPLDLVFSECFRLLQQVAISPMFERLPDYGLLTEVPPDLAELFQLRPVFPEGQELPKFTESGLESQYLPELTEFGYELLRDEILDHCIPRPVCLPLNLVAGIGFDCTNKRAGTNFPPHNVSEVIDALLTKLEHPKKTDARSIAKIIKGPDFAAGGTIIANCQELDKCYNEGEGTIMHKCDIIADKQIIRLAVLEPKFALQQLDAAINERKISGISSVTQHGSEVVATIEKGADLLSVKSRIHELPGFTTAINFDMTVVVGEREKYGDHSIYVASDGLPAIDIVKSRLPIDEIFQAFIERRLRFLREIHEINKTKAVSRMQNELLEFKRNYGQPRRTRIEIAK